MKLKLDMELIKKYSYILVGALLLIFIYKILDNFGTVANTFLNTLRGIIKILMPILIGLVLAYFLFRPMRGIEKFIYKLLPKSRKHPGGVRLGAILIVYIITITLIVLFFYATIPSVFDSLTGLINQMPDSLVKIDEMLGRTMAKGGPAQDILAGLNGTIDGLQNLTSRDIMNQITSYFGTNPDSIKEISNVAFIFVKGTVGFIISFFIVFFIGLYLMLDKEKVFQQVDRFAKAVMSKKIYNGSHWAGITIDDIFYKYFTGKILTSMLIGFLFYLGLLMIGVEYAPLFGMIVGVTNVIPYFGPIIGAVPAVVITLIDDPIKAVWVAICIIIVQQFDGNVLAPNVLGKIVELNPFWVLISVIIGGSLFGILGLFVAIPMCAVIKVFIEEALTRWERKKERLLWDDFSEIK
ncbi:AI-2E family transporter [Acetobacterium bakii]|uniref:AI-2E family transporter n=1 Tax=Acetobacterium bakii TaxID=52689 RepID=UPI001FA7BF9D|nr:AI-2E family transporter [Acetobacterium bakii]